MNERLTYAVGDIHGRQDLLTTALDAIEHDAGVRAADVVFLGDYVDRGPDSRAVVETLMQGSRRIGDRFICLMGNHEEMMLQAAGGDGSSLLQWIQNGGEETLDSYDGRVPEAHLDWVAGLPRLHETEHHVFVHAGLMPGYAISEQSDEWLLWIRRRFLVAEPEWGKHVVHGHTPQWEDKPDPTKPELLPHRTNLDTKAYASGVLTVGVFDGPGGPVRLLQTGDHRKT